MKTGLLTAIILFFATNATIGEGPSRPVNKEYLQTEFNRLQRVRQNLERSAIRIKQLEKQVKERKDDLKKLDDRYDRFLQRSKLAKRERDAVKWGVRPYKCPENLPYSQCKHLRTKANYQAKRDTLDRERKEFLSLATKTLLQKIEDRKTLGKYEKSLLQKSSDYRTEYNAFIRDLEKYKKDLQKK